DSVLVAENGFDALMFFQQRGAEITGVVLDIAMPIMGGEEAFRNIREIRPDVPVLVASGYSELDARERFGGSVNASFIQKPYTVMQLAEKLTHLVGSKDHQKQTE